MSISAISGGNDRWHLGHARASAAAGSSAPSSDITDLLGGSQLSQVASLSTAGAGAGAGLSGVGSKLISGVQSVLTSLQSELSGGSVAATASGAQTAGSSGASSASPGLLDDPVSQILQAFQAYGAKSSAAASNGLVA